MTAGREERGREKKKGEKETSSCVRPQEREGGREEGGDSSTGRPGGLKGRRLRREGRKEGRPEMGNGRHG